jgi:hypothetical protein
MISEGRGMPRLVEDAGEPLFAGWLSRVNRANGQLHGVRWVGGRRVAWDLDDRDGVGLTHRPADLSAPAARYVVGVVYTDLPCGGFRWWFACPGCQHRVDVLYLPADRDRVACRVCCGLKYRSQYRRGKPRRRKRRPSVEVICWSSIWTPHTGLVTKTTRRPLR